MPEENKKNEVKWTEDQQAAIDTRNCDVLVSAAAGSGKTAVLVQRIIEIITDTVSPVSIDELLIVTFTNAAAAEMRERIGNAIMKKLEDDPFNRNLQKQLTLLSKANICTLHAFCLNLIRNNFHLLNLDPDFRVADSTEIALLKQEALDEVFEESYEEGSEDFHNLIESYCNNKSDSSLYDLVLKLYSFIMSIPEPEKWLRDKAEMFNIDNADEVYKSLGVFEKVSDECRILIKKALKYIECAKNIIDENFCLEKYKDTIEGDYKALLLLKEKIENFSDISAQEIQEINFERMPTVRFKELDEKSLQEEMKTYRDLAKDILGEIKERTSIMNGDSIVKEGKILYPLMKELSKVVIAFKDRFNNKKRDKAIVDFNDQEHFALELLVDKNDAGEEVPSEVAKELKNKFYEILVDEYQDSNDVQEKIVKIISGDVHGERNRFMVGDLKQSIYRFRMAKPELFKEKKNSFYYEKSISTEEFSKLEKDNRLITLHKNFRSRNTIVDGINYIFRMIMSEEVGELNYDEGEELKTGAIYPEEEGLENKVGGPLEFHVINMEDSDTSDEKHVDENNEDIVEDDDEEEEMDTIAVEAAFVCNKIKEIMDDENGLMVYDGSMKSYRKAMFKDIVILLRSANKYAPVFLEEFKKANIPLYSDAGGGYFDTIEVKTIISLLQIIDNPRQDIPLIAVMKSPIGGFSSRELAEIKLNGKGYSFYEAMVQCNNMDNQLGRKIIRFTDNLSKWREESVYTPINKLIWSLFMETGYYGYVGAMPGGEQRQANLKILFQRARDFENTSYKGLYNFINFINNLKVSSQDMGAAKTIGENENIVRVMSIHKSKGLEFPVVFLCGMNKQFNETDIKSKVLFHHKLGYGPMVVNLKERTINSTIQREFISSTIKKENKSEEMRLLYVALTRAKEKIYMVSTVKGIDKKIKKWVQAAMEDKQIIDPHYIGRSKTYTDWIIPALLRHSEGKPLREIDEHTPSINILDSNSKWNVEIHSKKTMVFCKEEIEKKDIASKLKKLKDTEVDEELMENINNRLEYKYNYMEASKLPAVMTVSQLKEKDMEEFQYDYKQDVEDNEEVKSYSIIKKPEYLKEEKGLSSSEKGIALHKVMEKLDMDNANSKEDINSQLRTLVVKDLITEEERKTINVNKILIFLSSTLGKRIIEASKKGNLKREVPFRMNVKASDNLKDDSIVLRGIIDMLFEEHGEMVIVDYKTDYVGSGNDQELRDKYKTQLQCYKSAVEKLLGKKVKEQYIYSFWLDREIIL